MKVDREGEQASEEEIQRVIEYGIKKKDLCKGEFSNNILFAYLLLRQLDSRLSLVMIAERMDESLVLLAHQV